MSRLKEQIKEVYSGIVLDNDAIHGCCTPVGYKNVACCGPTSENIGFSEDYSRVPGYIPEADFGLGCGTPVAFSGIENAQTVLDLGSGAGNDAFVARSLVGENGRFIGVDFTPEMIEKANSNKDKLGYNNIDFLLGDIENLPLLDNSVNVVISNCVVNLVPDKLAAFREIHRVLKPKGHFCISDIVLTGEITVKMKSVIELYAGCISGAMVKSDYLHAIKSAGFNDVEIKTEKTLQLSDDYLIQYLTKSELSDYRNSGSQVLSITVVGKK